MTESDEWQKITDLRGHPVDGKEEINMLIYQHVLELLMPDLIYSFSPVHCRTCKKVFQKRELFNHCKKEHHDKWIEANKHSYKLWAYLQ